MKTPVLIVIIASAVVLCALPAFYIFLAYHTYRERQRWKVDHDMAIAKMEAEGRRTPRAASAASSSTYSSSGPGRAPTSQHYFSNHHKQSPAPSRPAPAHHPRWAPPRPPRELDVFNSSRDHLSSQADAAPRATPQGSGKNIKTPAPGSRATTRSNGGGRSSRGSEKQQQKQKQQKQQERQQPQSQPQPRPSSSIYEATSEEASQGTRPLPPASRLSSASSRIPPSSSRLPPATQLPPASQFF